MGLKNNQIKALVRQQLNAELSGLRTSARQRDRLYQQAIEGRKIKRKLTASWIVVLTLMLCAATAVAAALLTHRQIVEQVAVPMALENDMENTTEESYTHEELAQLIAVLNENGISLDEDTKIMQALKNGQGYWEEEALMSICREAFGGLFYEWSIEEKHWFETMTVQIGFKEKNPYLVPQEGDMSIPEAKAHAEKLLKDEYGVELPTESDTTWQICEWLYAPWDDDSQMHPAQWKFEYIYRGTGETEYIVNFTRDGQLLKIHESDIHGEVSEAESFSMARQMISNKHNNISDWPMEAWAEYGRLIAPLQVQNLGDWLWQNAGYQTPPANAISQQEAIRLAAGAVGLDGDMSTQVICCKDNGSPIYKVRLSIYFFGSEVSAAYDVIWCVEMDCMTGEVTGKREYRYADSDPMMMYVPFSVLDSAPLFE